VRTGLLFIEDGEGGDENGVAGREGRQEKWSVNNHEERRAI